MIFLIIIKRKFFYILVFLLAALTVIVAINSSRRLLERFFPIKYNKYVDKYSMKYGVDPFLVYAMIKAESGFDSDAVSHKKAIGLMQIIEKTGFWAAEEIGMQGFSVEELYNPEVNIHIGCWYLDNLMKEFNGNLDLVIAAYNGGSGNVKKWINNKQIDENNVLIDNIPFGETKRYVKRVKLYTKIYKKLYGRDTGKPLESRIYRFFVPHFGSNLTGSSY